LAHPPATSGETFVERLMTSLYQILMLILNVAIFLVLAHFIMSWLINFQVLNIRQPLVAQVWHGLNRLLEPFYGTVRRILPPMGGLDLAPLVVLIVIYALQIILTNNAAVFL
jgi:YggT family protein